MPRSFFFRVGEVWPHPRWISSPLDRLGVKSKECQEIPSSFTIITTSSQLFFNNNVIEQRLSKHTLPSNRLVNAMVAAELLHWKDTIFSLLTSKSASHRRSWLSCLVNQGQSPQISRHRSFPETKDADTTATTIETIFNDNDADNGFDWQYWY